MPKRNSTSNLPPVVVSITEGEPTLGQVAAWRRLWDKLLSPDDATPASGNPNRGKNGDEDDE